MHHTIGLPFGLEHEESGSGSSDSSKVISWRLVESWGWTGRDRRYVVRSTRCPPYTVALHHVSGTKYTLSKSRRDDVMPLAGGVNKAVSELSQHPLPP